MVRKTQTKTIGRRLEEDHSYRQNDTARKLQVSKKSSVAKAVQISHPTPLQILLAFASHDKDPHIHLMCHGHYVRYLDKNRIVIDREAGALDTIDLATKKLFGITDEPQFPECLIDHYDAHTVAVTAHYVLLTLVGKNPLTITAHDGSDPDSTASQKELEGAFALKKMSHSNNPFINLHTNRHYGGKDRGTPRRKHH